MSFDPYPSGLDWANGLGGLIGTPINPSQIIAMDMTGLIDIESKTPEELPDSPEIERAEQATLTHRFSLPWGVALQKLIEYGRGTLLQDSSGNVTKVLSCKVQRQPGGLAILIVVSEGLSFDTPPDKFSIVPVELGLNILKHPRYFFALQGANNTEATANQYVIRLLQDYFENSWPLYRDYLENRLYWSVAANMATASPVSNGDGTYTVTPPGQIGTPNTVITIPGTDLAKSAAMEIVTKYWRGTESPYIVGYQITWSAFYFRPPFLNPGGYIEDPILQANPQLPAYFISPDYPPTLTNTIFDRLAVYNPQCYSDTGYDTGAAVISWLRKADQIVEERTWFQVDRIWIGSPVGFWDPDIYAAQHRPDVVSDYNTLTPGPPPNPSQIPQLQQ
ncbi:MAG TPA: hypothetical protein VG167_08085 [Verrucomicrobiae bacterium]|nr:hypothetical protein [Verrucomicrobiae bacterium]